MNELDKIYDQSNNKTSFADLYFKYIGKILRSIDRDEVAKFIQTLLDARERGNKIFFVGNGGSAATASHFANDIAIGTRSFDKPFQSISLTDNISNITAIANDYGYEYIFKYQLKSLMKKNDVVVAISASGNSPNIIKCIDYANEYGGITVGLTAFDGGLLRKKAQQSVHVPTNKGEYGPAEDAHMILDHLVSTFLTKYTNNN